MNDGRMLLVIGLAFLGLGKAARFIIRTCIENARVRKHLGTGAYKQLTEKN